MNNTYRQENINDEQDIPGHCVSVIDERMCFPHYENRSPKMIPEDTHSAVAPAMAAYAC